jgi:amidase
MNEGPNGELVTAVEVAAEVLVDAGYALGEVELPRLEDALQGYGELNTEFSLAWPRIGPLLTAESARDMEESMRRLPAVDLSGYIGATGKRHGFIRDWREFQERYPVLLGPVTSEISGDVDAIAEVTKRSRTVLGLCAESTFVGIPAISAPMELIRGMPVGVQIIGQHFREDVCVAAATTIENSLGVPMPMTPSSS